VSPVAATTPISLETLTLDAFTDRRVLVLGLARSGIALARFLADRGAQVTVYDARPHDELADAVAALDGRPVAFQLGPHIVPERVLEGQALVATSPSISSRYPTTEPRLRAALAAVEAEGRVPVVSEVDLFLRLCPALTIGVTGTKGKTTTSSLVAAVLERGSEPVVLGGNIGTPLVERLPELTARHRVVLELSELQLPTLSRGTQVAVYTHVTSDHLDRHGSTDAYQAVKRRLAELVPSDGALVVNDEDPVSRGYGSATHARIVRYTRGAPPRGGVGIRDGWIVADRVAPLGHAGPGGHGSPDAGGPIGPAGPGADVTGAIVPLVEIPLPGDHSRSNVAAAVAAGLLLGVEPAAIRAAVSAFAGVEHRLEVVTVRDRVRYVNDSQGTQPDAVEAALDSFPAPLVLIAGGRDKGVPMGRLAAVAARRLSAAVLIGESGPALAVAFRSAGVAHVEEAATLPDAVVRADALVRELLAGGPPDAIGTVLLSPAAASFDMFIDYAARGRAFKDAVRALADTHPARRDG
jgi:UDP-N-acetylmuramoylalanine--D-glutamate ligase